MGSHDTNASRRPRLDRERALRLLTFWLRPDFVLRVVNRFQRLAGFDRAIGLASSALTATIALSIVTGAILPDRSGRDTAQRLIDRYDLSGGGAEAVRDVFAPASGTTTSVSVIGALFLLLTVLSFTRAFQRLVEQAWELKPLSVRNSLNGFIWSAGLVVYVTVSGTAHVQISAGWLELASAAAVLPFSAAFFVWSVWLLSGRRLPWRNARPFGILAAVLLAAYGIGAGLYVPHMFSTYASRYGVIGAVFAMISSLFCVMLVLVVSAAAGREVHDELDRIRRGERPVDDEVRRQWDLLIADARSRWRSARAHLRPGGR